jgi:hypothetical protein
MLKLSHSTAMPCMPEPMQFGARIEKSKVEDSHHSLDHKQLGYQSILLRSIQSSEKKDGHSRNSPTPWLQLRSFLVARPGRPLNARLTDLIIVTAMSH